MTLSIEPMRVAARQIQVRKQSVLRQTVTLHEVESSKTVLSLKVANAKEVASVDMHQPVIVCTQDLTLCNGSLLPFLVRCEHTYSTGEGPSNVLDQRRLQILSMSNHLQHFLAKGRMERLSHISGTQESVASSSVQ